MADAGFAARLITGSAAVAAVRGFDEAVVGRQSGAGLERAVESRGGIRGRPPTPSPGCNTGTAPASLWPSRVARRGNANRASTRRCGFSTAMPARISTASWNGVEARSPLTASVAGRTGPTPNASAGAWSATRIRNIANELFPDPDRIIDLVYAGQYPRDVGKAVDGSGADVARRRRTPPGRNRRRPGSARCCARCGATKARHRLDRTQPGPLVPGFRPGLCASASWRPAEASGRNPPKAGRHAPGGVYGMLAPRCSGATGARAGPRSPGPIGRCGRRARRRRQSMPPGRRGRKTRGCRKPAVSSRRQDTGTGRRDACARRRPRRVREVFPERTLHTCDDAPGGRATAQGGEPGPGAGGTCVARARPSGIIRGRSPARPFSGGPGGEPAAEHERGRWRTSCNCTCWRPTGRAARTAAGTGARCGSRRGARRGRGYRRRA